MAVDARPAGSGMEMSARFETLMLQGAMLDKQKTISATLVTGFLGSGKTTLVENILRQKGGLRVAVVVDEFAEKDVDSDILQAASVNAAVGVVHEGGHGGNCSGDEKHEFDAASKIHGGTDVSQGNERREVQGGADVRPRHEGNGTDRLLGSHLQDGGCHNGHDNEDHHQHPHNHRFPENGSLSSGVDCRGSSCSFPRERLQRAVKHAVGGMLSGCDHLIIESCGLTNPYRMLDAIADLAVSLDRIVAVLDAESLPALIQRPLVLRQLAVADVILINKCDLAALGQISAVEDLLEQRLNSFASSSSSSSSSSSPPPSPPPPTILRTRFCQVPLDVVLDTSPPLLPSLPLTSAAADSSSGFLSHEASSRSASATSADVKRTNQISSRIPKGGQRAEFVRSREGEAEGGGKEEGSVSHYQDEGWFPDASWMSSILFSSSSPLSLAAFQKIVASHLSHPAAPSSIVRAKGVLCFSECRRWRYIFQMSGRSRCQLLRSFPWSSPPGCSLTLIGSDQSKMRQIARELEGAVRENEDKLVGSRKDETAGSMDKGVDSFKEGGKVEGGVADFRRFLGGDERFKVLGLEEGSSPDFVRFGLKGYPLKGVSEGSLNEALMQGLNANSSFFFSLTENSGDGRLLSVSLDASIDPNKLWAAVLETASKVLKRALKHVSSCRCDITVDMRRS